MKINKQGLILCILVLALSLLLSAFSPSNSDTGYAPQKVILQDEEPTPEPEEPVQLPYVEPSAPTQSGLTFSTGIIVGLVVAGGVILLILIGWLFGRRSTKGGSESGQDE